MYWKSLKHWRIQLKTNTHTQSTQRGTEIIKVYWSSFNDRRVSKATESMKCTLCSARLKNPAGWAISSMLPYSPVLKMTSEPWWGSIFRCWVGERKRALWHLTRGGQDYEGNPPQASSHDTLFCWGSLSACRLKNASVIAITHLPA